MNKIPLVQCRDSKSLHRRQFLLGAGAMIGLPWLESWPPAKNPLNGEHNNSSPKRLVCLGVDLGMYADGWVPKEMGANYTMPSLLEPLKEFRNHFTLLSKSDHPGVSGGHRGVAALLSGVFNPVRIGGAEVIRNSVTIDQFVANRIGSHNRYESLQLSATNIDPLRTLSWNENGVPLIPCGNATKVFKQLFVDDANPQHAEQALQDGKSILDAVIEDTKELNKHLAISDKARIDDYTTGIREVEKRIERQRLWARTAKPGIPNPIGQIVTYHENLDAILELAALALSTDSTRVISVQLPNTGLPIQVGNLRVLDYHPQSHHGKDPKMVAELVSIETQHMKCVAKFLKRLQFIKEGDQNVLDRTQVLFGAGMGNASSHSNRDLPIMLAGGGLKHGKHLSNTKKEPLCNLFVTMLHGLDIMVDKFSSSMGNFDHELLS